MCSACGGSDLSKLGTDVVRLLGPDLLIALQERCLEQVCMNQ
jgi:hypothetical protein